MDEIPLDKPGFLVYRNSVPTAIHEYQFQDMKNTIDKMYGWDIEYVEEEYQYYDV